MGTWLARVEQLCVMSEDDLYEHASCLGVGKHSCAWRTQFVTVARWKAWSRI